MEEADRLLFERSVAALEKLAQEAARLRGDVARLNARIEPLENEPPFDFPVGNMAKPQNFREVLDEFASVRDRLLQAERHINRIAARMDQIHNSSWSREDMKPWIKN